MFERALIQEFQLQFSSFIIKQLQQIVEYSTNWLVGRRLILIEIDKYIKQFETILIDFDDMTILIDLIHVCITSNICFIV
jgi:hypothetical protein